MAERRALVRNAGDPQQVKSAKETEKQRATREAGELDVVLSSYEGRSVLWRVLEQCRLRKLSFDMDQYRTAFHEGHRNVGNWLLMEIARENLPAYQLMEAEAAKREALIQDPKDQKKQQPEAEYPPFEDEPDGN